MTNAGTSVSPCAASEPSLRRLTGTLYPLGGALNHYPRHCGDITQATFGLSLAEFGAYDRLLDAYYVNECALPLDLLEVHRIAGAKSKADRACVTYVLQRYFTKQDDGWHQKRADEELSAYRNRVQVARVNGHLGGRPPNPKETESVISDNPKGTEKKTNQEPVTGNQEPVAKNQEPKPQRSKSLRGAVAPAPTSEAWKAYSRAYFDRYGVEPVWNAKVGGHFASLIRRVGMTEAPHVAAHYVLSQRSQYVLAKHPASLLDRDAESLRTEWATRTHGTESEARSGDKTAARGNVFGQLIDEAKRGR